MPDPTTRGLKKLALAAVAAAGLSGCASDPAFMEGLAVFADTLAAETARCHYRTNAWGGSEYYCPPSYGAGYGYVTPTYRPHPDRHDRRDRRDWRRDRDGRDHDRDHRRRDRRGGKG